MSNEPCKIFHPISSGALRQFCGFCAFTVVCLFLLFPSLALAVVTLGTVRFMDCIDKKLLSPIYTWGNGLRK